MSLCLFIFQTCLKSDAFSPLCRCLSSFSCSVSLCWAISSISGDLTSPIAHSVYLLPSPLSYFVSLTFRDNTLAANAPMRLETLTYSHFVERTRWCLDLLGEEYEEEHNIVLLGVFVKVRDCFLICDQVFFSVFSNFSPSITFAPFFLLSLLVVFPHISMYLLVSFCVFSLCPLVPLSVSPVGSFTSLAVTGSLYCCNLESSLFYFCFRVSIFLWR